MSPLMDQSGLEHLWHFIPKYIEVQNLGCALGRPPKKQDRNSTYRCAIKGLYQAQPKWDLSDNNKLKNYKSVQYDQSLQSIQSVQSIQSGQSIQYIQYIQSIQGIQSIWSIQSIQSIQCIQCT